MKFRGPIALSSMVLIIVAFLLIGIFSGDFYKVPMLVVFISVAAYALLITRQNRHTKTRLRLVERLAIFSRGAGEKNLLHMIWIFTLAGAFSESARSMSS